MKFIAILFISLLINSSILADLIKPSPNIKPKEVIAIQLEALMKNDILYIDSGIRQTWEFAHPQNRQYTGPLSNFISMMKSGSYKSMLNHLGHNIIFVFKDDTTANYFVELIDKNDNKLGFTWTLKKVLIKGKFKDCWMTTSVSKPLPLAKSV